MNKVHSLITAALLSAAVPAAHAQTYDSVVVDMADGSQTTVTLEKGMTTEFSSTSVIFSSPAGTAVDLNKDDVVAFSFSETSGVADIAGNAAAPALTSGGLSFSNLPAGSSISVHDTAGRLAESATASGDFTLPLGDLPAGVYIVTVNGTSYKISVK